MGFKATFRVALAKSPKGTCQCVEDTGKLEDSLGPCHPTAFEKSGREL